MIIIRALFNFFERKMKIPQNQSNFNNLIIKDISQDQIIIESPKNKINSELPQEKERINLFHKELDNNLKRINENININKRKSSNLFHFNFNMDLIELNNNSNNNSEKKRNSFSYINMSLVEKRIESNLNYVGFENNYGENSCYINVILHFLYYFPSVYDFLIKFYKDRINNFEFINDDIALSISRNKNNDYFMFLLGKILFEYQSILSNFYGKSITILNTKEFRYHLQKISNNIYSFKKIGDPVELLLFLLEKINEYNSVEIHNDFFINLIEEKNCNFCLNKKEINNYDKDNFIHYIYANGIIDYINQRKIPFSVYNHRLFEFSRELSSSNNKNCEQCGRNKKCNLNFIGNNYPKYLLLNCVWNRNQDIKDILKFLYLLSLEDNLNNLFICENNNPKKSVYNLFGMILYSSALSHYISILFNMEKNTFILYDDDKIKELSSIHEVYKEITYEQLKKNPKAFFYPVLLIYYKELIYNDDKTIKLNEYSYNNFHNLEEDCLKALNSHISLTEEEKRQNYLEYVKAQNAYIRKRKYSMEPLNNSFEMIIEEEQKDINNNNNNNFTDKKDENKNNNMIVDDYYSINKKEKTEKKRINKRAEIQYIPNYNYRPYGIFRNLI